MQQTIIHVVNSIREGGIERGLQTLVEDGFYKGKNLCVVELVRGSGDIHDELAEHLGRNHFFSLTAQKENPSVTLSLSRHIWELSAIFNRLQPQVIVLSHIVANIVGRVAAFPYPSIQVVSFEHDTLRQPRNARLALRGTSPRVNLILADTPATLLSQQSNYMFKRPAHIVPLTILEPGVARTQGVPHRFKILSLGRLASQKNFDGLLHAFAHLVDKGYDA